ncbi:MAG TPA: glucose-6-phosphate dehydrogenase, partial [Trueperaceae bacterium]
RTGVLRDMFQNHMLQLLALVAMEPPTSFAADDIRNEKVQVIGAVRPLDPVDSVRGQYRGYRQAPDVAPDSRTATYAALACYIDNWRWQDVPFYLRSGKALRSKSTEIVIRFKRPPRLMHEVAAGEAPAANILSLCIQPNEGIHLSFESKVPDTQAGVRSVDMDFRYRDSYGPDPLPRAYDRLLLDALRGDPSLFARSDAIEAAWRLIDPLVAAWQGKDAPPLVAYQPGSWGPAEAEALLGRSGRAWRLHCAQEDRTQARTEA